jgi:hypothetical protein
MKNETLKHRARNTKDVNRDNDILYCKIEFLQNKINVLTYLEKTFITNLVQLIFVYFYPRKEINV